MMTSGRPIPNDLWKLGSEVFDKKNEEVGLYKAAWLDLFVEIFRNTLTPNRRPEFQVFVLQPLDFKSENIIAEVGKSFYLIEKLPMIPGPIPLLDAKEAWLVCSKEKYLNGKEKIYWRGWFRIGVEVEVVQSIDRIFLLMEDK